MILEHVIKQDFVLNIRILQRMAKGFVVWWDMWQTISYWSHHKRYRYWRGVYQGPQSSSCYCPGDYCCFTCVK